MAFIAYHTNQVAESDRVQDQDNIIQISSIHSRVMKQHYDLYLTLMRKKSPLTRIQRESIGVLVSQINLCHY